MRNVVRKMTAVFSGVAVLFVVSSSALALTSRTGDEVRFTGEGCQEGNVYLAGGVVEVDRDICGDLYIGGGQVRVRANVAGDLVIGGGEVEVSEGRVEGDVRIGTGNLRFGGEVGGEVLVFGGQTAFQSGTVVFGETHVFSGMVDLNGTYNAPVFLEGGQTRVNGRYRGDVHSMADEVIIAQGAVLERDLVYSSPKEATIEDRGGISGEIRYTRTEGAQQEDLSASGILGFFGSLGLSKGRAWASMLWDGLFGILRLFVVVIVISAFYLRGAERIRRIVNAKTGMLALYGLLALVATPIVGIILLVTGILSPFGVLALALYALVLMFSKAMLVLYLQQQFLAKMNKYLAFLLLSAAVMVVAIIPVVGGLLKLAIVVFGLGVFAAYCMEKYKRQQGMREKGEEKLSSSRSSSKTRANA